MTDSISSVHLSRFRALGTVLEDNPFYTEKFAGFDLQRITNPELFRELPFTTKAELSANQAATPPYGTNLSFPLNRYSRYHQTSGTTCAPLRWLDTPESWAWILDCWDAIYDTAGITRDSRLFFPFSFGPFIGFWAAFEAATRRGSFSLSGGGMSTDARLQAILDHDITTICCTPTYAIRLGRAAAESGLDLPSSRVNSLIVAGEPGGSIPNVRARIEKLWGARVLDHSGMTEIGSMSIECGQSPCDPHVLETEFLVECVDGDGQPVEDGIAGELVITNLGRTGSPIIRYRTGDEVVFDRSPCPCGSPWLRLKGGVRGRMDDMIHIKGNNVYPANIEDVVRSMPDIDEFRLRVSERDGMHELTIEIECGEESKDDIALALRDALRSRYHFTVPVHVVESGSLPRFEMKARRLVFDGDAS